MYDVVSQNFSIYVSNICNFGIFLDNFSYSVDKVYNQLKEGIYIGTVYSDEVKKYPKYLSNTNAILKTHLFNYPRIYNSVFEDVQVVKRLIPKSLLYIKNNCDKIPIKKEDIDFEVAFQKIYYYGIEETFNYVKDFFLYQNVEFYEEFFYRFFGTELSKSFSQLENFQQVTNSYFISTYIQKKSNFSDQISKIFNQEDLLNSSNISESFNLLFDDTTGAYSSFTQDLNSIILQKNYSMFNPTGILETFSENLITDYIDNLKDSFLNYLIRVKRSFNREFSNILIGLINQVLTGNFLENLNEDDNIINSTDYFKMWTNFNSDIYSEESYVSYYLNIFKRHSLQQYMYVLMSYKNYPEKFLNILPIILKEFVIRYVYKETDYNEFLDQFISSPLIDYDQNISFSNYHETYQNNISTNKVIEIFNDENNLKSVFVLYFFPIIDSFIESDEFSNFIESFLLYHQRKMFENGFLDFYFNWYQYKKSFKLFFNVFLKKQILDGNLFSNQITNINSQIKEFLESPSSYPDYELSFTDSQDDIEENFKRFCQLKTSADKVKTTIQNTLYNTIFKQLYLNIISYYRV